MKCEKLESGAVLVENMGPKHIEPFAEEKAEEILPDESLHGLIFYEEERKKEKKSKILHTQSGGMQTGVRSHPIDKAIKSDRFLGDVYVIQPTDAKTRELLVKVSTRWDPKLTYQQALKLPRSAGSAILPTPFRKRPSEHSEKNYNVAHTLYRAFRAYERNHKQYKEPHTKQKLVATPLSKHKGISCSDLIAYSYKVTLLESKFPKKLPKDIRKAMDKIESYKKKHKIKKLTDIPLFLFAFFQDSVLEHIPDNKTMYLLSKPVKGMGIEFFSEKAFSEKNDWEFVGYLCYVKTTNEKQEEILQPYVMDHEMYEFFLNQQKEPDTFHSIIVTQDEIDNAKAKLMSKMP